MAFKISDFSAKIDKWGVQKSSHFEVVITPPNTVSDNIIDDIPFRANSANLPGYNVGFDEIKHRGYGLNEKRANMLSFEDVSITFIVDGGGKISKFFEDWRESIFPIDDEKIGMDATELHEYPVDYFGIIEVSMFDMAGTKHTTWHLQDAYPTNVGAMQVAWESTDSILILPVSFAYRKYKIDNLNSSRL